MKISRQILLTAVLLAAIGPIRAFASDANGERDISVYDKQPQCTERRELKPGQVDPCEIQNGPPRRRVVGADKGAGSNGSGASSSTNASQSGAQARR